MGKDFQQNANSVERRYLWSEINGADGVRWNSLQGTQIDCGSGTTVLREIIRQNGRL